MFQRTSRDKEPDRISAEADSIDVFVAAFANDATATRALQDLQVAETSRLLGITTAALLRRDHAGKLHIKKIAEMGNDKPATISGVVGAVIGVVAGPTLAAPAVVVALVCGLAARLRESDFSSAGLIRFAKKLGSGDSAVLAIVVRDSAEVVGQVLTATASHTFLGELSGHSAGQLEVGHDVAYSAFVAREGLSLGRRRRSPYESEGGMVIVDTERDTASRYVPTPAGFAVHSLDVDGGHSLVRPDVTR